MATSSTSFHDIYHQAVTGASAVRHETPGVILLTGNDRLSFLHRMTTNAVEGLNTWSLRSTTLTSPLARTIDRLWIVHRDEDLLALTSPKRGQTVHSWLNRHIFFNDEVQATIPAEKWSLWGLYGPEAVQRVQDLFRFEFPGVPGAVVPIEGGLAMRWNSPGGVRLLLEPGGDLTAADRWPSAISETAAAVFDTLRVEAGYPLFGSEFNEDSVPLEAGLRSTIDFQKGCYTGQEIIARMDSRGQLARRLVGFHLVNACVPGKITTADGHQAGILASCANSPRLGWIGLGVIKTQYLENDTAFLLADHGQPIRWVQLPFTLPE